MRAEAPNDPMSTTANAGAATGYLGASPFWSCLVLVDGEKHHLMAPKQHIACRLQHGVLGSRSTRRVPKVLEVQCNPVPARLDEGDTHSVLPGRLAVCDLDQFPAQLRVVGFLQPDHRTDALLGRFIAPLIERN